MSNSVTGQLPPDTVLEGRYIIVETIGRGGMGAVYKALDIRLQNMPVAIKEMSTEAMGKSNLKLAAESFQKEASMLINLKHPSLPRITDFFSRGEDRWYLVMDYIKGDTLSEVVKKRGPIPEHEVLNWARQLCSILDYLHNQKPAIIFRDLKPANIILTPEGNIKLIDFGIARHFRPGMKSDTSAYGSPGYAPPEQHGENQTDPRSDIYALGATLYHFITGIDPSKRPFMFDPPKNFVVLSPRFESAIMQALELTPEKRPSTARAFLEMLPANNNAVRQTETLLIEPKPKLKNKRRYFIYGGIGIIVLFIIAGVIYQQVSIKKLQTYQQLVDEAARLSERGKYAEAERTFFKAQQYQDRAELYHYLGKMYIEENKHQQAVDLLNDKIQKGVIEEDSIAFYILGSAYYNLQDYHKASWYLEKSIEINPTQKGDYYEQAMRDLAVVCGRLGLFDKAEEILKDIKNSSSTPNHIKNYIMGELNLARRNYVDALNYFQMALNEDPQNIRYRLSAAKLYSTLSANASSQQEKEENLQYAITILIEGEQTDPYNIQLLSDYGKYCYDLGELYSSTNVATGNEKYQQALVVFNRIRELGVIDGNTLLNLAIIYDKLDRYNEADNSFQEALKIDSGDSHANFIYGLFNLKHKRYEVAYKYLQATVDLNENPEEVSIARDRISELRAKGWI